MLTADEIVSNFFLDTCQLNPRWNVSKFVAFKCSTLSDDIEFGLVAAGSVRDIYIQPILECTRDVNRLLYPHNAIALPSGHQLPSHLPPEFRSYECLICEIISSEVYLDTHTYTVRRHH
jgi:hypothetical protein